MKKLMFLLSIIAIGIIASCKKSSSSGVTDLLTAHTWKATTFNENGADLTAWCTLNSTSKYNSDGSGVYTEGDNHGACSGTAIGDTFHFSWKLIDNDSKIVYGTNYPGYNDTAEIKLLNSTALKLNYLITDVVPNENWLEGFVAN